MFFRLLILALIGAITEGVLLSAFCYVASRFLPSSSGSFLPVSEPEKLYAIAGGVVGASLGLILGSLIGGLNLSIGKAIVLSLGTHLVIGLLFIVWTGSDPFFESLVGGTFIALVLSGTLAGILVSIANQFISRGS